MSRPSQGCLGFWVQKCPDVGIHWNRTHCKGDSRWLCLYEGSYLGTWEQPQSQRPLLIMPEGRKPSRGSSAGSRGLWALHTTTHHSLAKASHMAPASWEGPEVPFLPCQAELCTLQWATPMTAIPVQTSIRSLAFWNLSCLPLPPP